MGTVTLIPTPLVTFMLDVSEAWDQLEYEEQLLAQERAKALLAAGGARAELDAERELRRALKRLDAAK